MRDDIATQQKNQRKRVFSDSDSEEEEEENNTKVNNDHFEYKREASSRQQELPHLNKAVSQGSPKVANLGKPQMKSGIPG